MERNVRSQQAKESEELLLKRTFAASPIGTIVTNRKGLVIAANRRAERVLGYDKSDIVGTQVRKLFFDSSEPHRIIAMLHHHRAEGISGVITAARGKTGQAIPISLSANWVYDESGELIGTVAYFEDQRPLGDAALRSAHLLEGSNIIAHAESLEAGLDGLAKIFVSLSPNTMFCRIWLLDEAGDRLCVRAISFRADQPYLGEELVASNHSASVESGTEFREILGIGQPVVLDLVDNELTEYPEALYAAAHLTSSVRYILIVPLVIGERAIGLFEIGQARAEIPQDTRGQERDLATAIAAQAAAVIDYRRQLQMAERRTQLLDALDAATESLRADREPEKLFKDIPRLGAQMFDCDVAALFINRPHEKELAIVGVYGFSDETLVGAQTRSGAELVADVSKTGHVKIIRGWKAGGVESPLGGYEFHLVAAVPLKQLGTVNYVLFLGDTKGHTAISQIDSPVLERFGVQASLALQTSSSKTLEQRVFNRLAILNKVAEYLQVKQPGGATDKLLHAALTGVTAGYGIAFNRAVLFFRTESDGGLVGQMGVGQIDASDARAAWAHDSQEGLSDFVHYIAQLEQTQVPETPVGRLARGMYFQVVPAATDAFSRAVVERRWIHVYADALGDLPAGFRAALQPDTDVAVVPLIAREQVIGLLVVDNKFTRSPITHADIEALLAFASTVALAFDNIRLFQHREAARQKLRSLYEASATLISAKEPQQMLRDIVELTRLAAKAHWVRLILTDELGRARALVTAGDADEVSPEEAVRWGGIAQRVLRVGRPEIIEDTSKEAHRLNPMLLKDRPSAALCLPLTLQDRNLGVMWITFKEPRQFPDFEIDALQLYANHAAVAYDNARRMDELNHLRLAAEALSSAGDAQGVLDQIACGCLEVMDADSAAIWSYDPVRNTFLPEMSVSRGIPDEDWKEFLKVEPREGGTAYTAMFHGYLCVEDISDAVRYPFIGGSTRNLLSRTGAKSFVGLALAVGQERLGVLYVNYNRPRAFTKGEQQTAQTFANHAALALKKARLRDQLAKARNAAKAVAEVTVLQSLPDTLKLVVERTLDAVNSDAVTLYTYDGRRNKIDFPPEWEGVWDPSAITGEVARESTIYKMLALDKMHVAENSRKDELMAGAFVERERISSSVGVPLLARGETGGVDKVGVMFVNYRQTHRFTEDDLINIELFANQAAVAIRNAQLYQQARERTQALQELYEAGQVITASLDLDQILENIAEYANRLACTSAGPPIFVHIRLIEGRNARIAATYPASEVRRCTQDLDLSLNKGVIARGVATGRTENVLDVTRDPHYVPCHPATRSELVVLLSKGTQVIGVINIEHADYYAFTEDTARVLESLAAQASIAIENATQYRELERARNTLAAQFEELNDTKTTLAARTALAWMGMASASWRHAIEGHAITISGELKLLEEDLSNRRSDQITRRLEKIDRLAREIRNKPITPSLSDQAIEVVAVADWIRERTAELWAWEPFASIDLELSFDEDANLQIKISSDWFRQAFDALIQNAQRAVQKCPTRKIRIGATKIGRYVEITIEDSGIGIPSDLLAVIFARRKDWPGGGLGMGLLMAQLIVQTYHGEIYVKETDTTRKCGGTTMAMRFPLVDTADLQNGEPTATRTSS